MLTAPAINYVLKAIVTVKPNATHGYPCTATIRLREHLEVREDTKRLVDDPQVFGRLNAIVRSSRPGRINLFRLQSLLFPKGTNPYGLVN